MKALLILLTFTSSWAFAQTPMEISCNIRKEGTLSCQVLGKERRSMTSDDVSNFLDAVNVAAFMTIKSKKGLERTFQVDANAPQYKKFIDIKRSGSISEVNKAKSDLFDEIEKKAIKVADDLDAQAGAAELVLFDSSITLEKARRESRQTVAELEGYRKNRDQICTATPAWEKMSRANANLQKTLSNILFAFSGGDTCMAEYKVFKDKDGAVDLRQLESVTDHFKNNCKKAQ